MNALQKSVLESGLKTRINILLMAPRGTRSASQLRARHASGRNRCPVRAIRT
jgi:hypothetical protein